jgi:hypothetical protein
MDIHIKRVRDTPYKLVINGHEVVGIFEHDIFIARDNMNDKQKHIVAQHHADGFAERFEELGNGG